MSVIVSDAYPDADGTNPLSRAPATGTTPVEHGSYSTGAWQIDGARVHKNSANASCFYYPDNPSTAEYDVEYTHRLITDTVGGATGGAGRIASGANTMYFVRHVAQATNQWQMFKLVAGAATSLGTTARNPRRTPLLRRDLRVPQR